MEQTRDRFDEMMNRKITIKGMSLSVVEILFMAGVFILGMLIRFSLRKFVSGDMIGGALYIWLDIIRENNGIHALAVDFGCYNPPYIYFLTLLSYQNTGISDMYFIKAFSILFDILAAYVMFLTIYKMTKNTRKSVWGFTAVWLAPTVFLNSAAWGQCDMLFTVFLLLCFYYILNDKTGIALMFMGLSFAIKLQAIFFLPFLIILWLKRRVRLLDFLMIPAMYFGTAIPAFLLGKPLKDFINIYIGQMGMYEALNASYPNFFAFFTTNEFTKYMAIVAVYFVVGILACIMLWLYTKRFEMTNEIFISIAMFTVSIVCFFLPYMHERYGFILDVFAIIYWLTSKDMKKMFAAILFNVISLIAYLPYLFHVEVPMVPVAVVFFVLMCYVGWDLWKMVEKSSYHSNYQE